MDGGGWSGECLSSREVFSEGEVARGSRRLLEVRGSGRDLHGCVACADLGIASVRDGVRCEAGVTLTKNSLVMRRITTWQTARKAMDCAKSMASWRPAHMSTLSQSILVGGEIRDG